jgi:acyl dehydratase
MTTRYASPSWDQIEIGDEPEPFEGAPLTITDFVRYQGASGDMNPIHHDQGFAIAAGYPEPFAVGMLQCGVMATFLTDWLSTDSVRSYRVQFREQAWPGDVLTYTARVVAKREESGERRVDLELACTRPEGGTHLKGWATVALPTEERP